MSTKKRRKNKVTAKQSIKKQELELLDIHPLNDAQERFFDNYAKGKSQVLSGSAGAGKTFLALHSAFNEILTRRKSYRRIVIVRSAVATRDIGHLPGTLEEKSMIYELPYKGVITEIFDNAGAYDILKDNGVVEFMLTSYVRGITLDDTIVIVDEYQNMSAHEADSVMTRLGKNSKIIFCGDTDQTDFTKANEKDIESFMEVLRRIPNRVDFNTFSSKDIVRSGLVRDYIIAKEKK